MQFHQTADSCFTFQSMFKSHLCRAISVSMMLGGIRQRSSSHFQQYTDSSFDSALATPREGPPNLFIVAGGYPQNGSRRPLYSIRAIIAYRESCDSDSRRHAIQRFSNSNRLFRRNHFPCAAYFDIFPTAQCSAWAPIVCSGENSRFELRDGCGRPP